MIVVVADTSPINYLVQIGSPEILRELYGRILLPEAVVRELRDKRTPPAVADWVERSLSWIEVHGIREPADATLSALGPGESGAIQLAQQEKADLLLIDERMGARIARARGLAVTGTLGILVQARRRGLVDMEQAIGRLQKTSFRCTPEVYAQVRKGVIE